MEPLTIITTLGKIFTAGALSYLGAGEAKFTETDVSALVAGLDALSSMHGLAKSKAPSRMAALHTALVLQAFGTAFREHWAGNESFAPKLEQRSWLHKAFLSKDEKAREAEIHARLDLAFRWLLPVKQQNAHAERVLEMYGLHPDPIVTPSYQSLYTAFADGQFEGNDATALFDMRRDGACLQFEGAFQMAYAELIATSSGQELARFLLSVEQDRPRQFRRRWVEELALGHRCHVFGAPTAGVPVMPLGFMYVEPNGVWNNKTKPLRQHIVDLLREHSMVFVSGDFGMGKSLTARMLAVAWAQAYLQNVDKPSPNLPFPILIRCARDFQRDSFKLTLREAFRNQAETMGISLLRDDDVFATPPDTMFVVYLVDGLDEVALNHTEQEAFFRELKGATSARHRVVVLSRNAALPPQEKLGGAPVVEVAPFNATQIGVWLEKWNEVSGRDEVGVEQLEKAKLLDLAQTPILLFMIAMTWDPTRIEAGDSSQVAIYEIFFQQIAAGKCKHDRDRHPRVADASKMLHEKLVELELIEKDAPLEQAMLWLMSRIAWEHKRCAQRNEPLDLQDVNQLLRSKLKLKGDPKAHEMIRMGALLVLQADLQDENPKILFGHKSFLEFLTARWWANRLRAIVAASSETKQIKLEAELYGAMLISNDETDRSFSFLMAILKGVTWKAAEREKLAEWAERSFQDERSFFETNDEAGERTWRDDCRPRLRHAALGIRCCLEGLMPFRVETEGIRSLIAWFWGRGEWARIVAPGANFQGANLFGANLYRANLYRANLQSANLQGANLIDANLFEANLAGANLFGVNLECANLEHVNLERANLEDAYLIGANLMRVNFDGADLKHADYDDATTWSASFDPAAAGASKR